MSNETESDGQGCLLLIGCAALPLGTGYIWGAGFGWLALGGLCIAVAVIETVLKARRR